MYLAQHFLYQEEYLQKIIQVGELDKQDIVLEIGAGTGSLTQRIIPKAGFVLAVELDPSLVKKLKKRFANCDNLKIIQGDFLKINQFKVALKEQKIENFKIMGNLPYYITGKILRKTMSLQIKITHQKRLSSLKPQIIVFVLQREVGEKICHPQKTSLLSLSIKIFGEPQIEGIIPGQAFTPPPQVDSVILKITLFKKPLFPEKDLPPFFHLLKTAFSAPRKMLKNNLKKGLSLTEQTVRDYLLKAKIPLNARAEEIKLKDWIRVYRIISQTNTKTSKERKL